MAFGDSCLELVTYNKELEVTMKRSFMLFMTAMLFVSCSEKLEDSMVCQSLGNAHEVVAYPMRSNKTRAGVDNEQGEWENWDKIVLAGGESVSSPWNEQKTAGAVPVEIRMDVKHKAGWNLIAHTVNGKGEKGLNYLVFYNRYTGILKVFYYAEENTPNNTGIWHLHFEQPQSFLAFSDQIAELSSSSRKNDIYVVNVTEQTGKPFTRGWNCFFLELAYDPSFSEGTLQIIPESLSTLKVSLGGDLDAYTEGTIITATSSNPLTSIVNGVANVAGKAAEIWVGNAIKAGKFSKVKNVVVEGAGTIVKKGVGSLLGAFVGGFNKNVETTQTVSLKTTGTIKLDGTISTVQSSSIVPLSMSISVKNVGRLGVWCLTQTPKVYVGPYALNVGKDAITSYWYKYQFLPRVDNTQTRYVTMNPDLVKELGWNNIHLGVDTYLQGNYIVEDLGESFSDRYAYASSFNDKLYDNTYSANGLSYTVSLPLFDKNGQVLENLDDMFVPYEIFLPNAPGGYKGASPNIRCQSYYKQVYGVQLTTTTGDTVQLYHTFIPRLQWDYSRFNSDKMYLHEYPTIPIGEFEE